MIQGHQLPPALTGSGTPVEVEYSRLKYVSRSITALTYYFTHGIETLPNGICVFDMYANLLTNILRQSSILSETGPTRYHP